MVREEYLNPEFMYKFINSLCKKDGWNMYHFVFGKLWYRNLKQPILMQNNHGYNMVYKFRVYKLPKTINYGQCEESASGEKLVYVSKKDLSEKIIKKDIYFDILNECFIEHDDIVETFEEFPSFFRLDNQIYYGIYGQPKVLRYHYCNGREWYDFRNYMRCMEITTQNLYDPYSLLYNKIGEEHKVISKLNGDFKYFVFDTHKEANSKITMILSEDWGWNCENFYRLDFDLMDKFRVNSCNMKKPTNICHRLYIHEPEFPVFYTDNILELTVPIAEAVGKLAVNVSKALNSIQHTLSLISTSTQRLMCDRLKDVYLDRYCKKWDSFEFPTTWGVMEVRSHEVTINALEPDREIYEAQLGEIVRSCSLTSKKVSKVQSDYEKLYSNIRKLKTSDFSLTKLLEISNAFKILESKTE